MRAPVPRMHGGTVFAKDRPEREGYGYGYAERLRQVYAELQYKFGYRGYSVFRSAILIGGLQVSCHR